MRGTRRVNASVDVLLSSSASGMVDEQEPYGRARADVWPTNEESVGILQAFAKRGGGGSSNGGPRWLAAIISANMGGTRFQTASHSASVVGFAVEHIPAATPAQYSGKRAMVQDLFGAADQQSVMISMTPFEIALLISHRRALRAIAASSYSWGAVFEDDAYLHEAVPPAHAKHLLAAAFAAADAAAARPLPPLLYIGSCQPKCHSGAAHRRDAIATGMSDALLRVGKCEAFCTHAYALSRRRAATFFDDVFDCREGGRGCASECDLWPCYMDWAMMRYFERAGEAWIVGGGFRGRWKRGHRGLFIQNRSLAAQGGAKVGRSGLAKSFRWTTVSNDSAILEEQACERNEMNVSQPKVPLQKLRITIDFQGRLGNLMFEVAMLAGMLRRLRKIVNDTEAVAFKLPSSIKHPARQMFEQFGNLSKLVTRHEWFGRTGFEQGAKVGGCEACAISVIERWPNACDQKVLRRLKTWAAAPPRGCRLGFIKLSGFFQSHQYFAGAVGDRLRSTTFASPAAAQREADGILASIRRKMPSGGKVIGVQVRLGDRVGSGTQAETTAATSWAYYRTAMDKLRATLMSQGAADVAIVVTAGGTMGDNSVDVAQARHHLSFDSGRSRLHFSTAQSPYADLDLLRRCDALVVGPSSFGWWAAYLANLPAGLVVAPRHLYSPHLPPEHILVRGFRQSHYYPAGWRLLENDGNVTADFFLSPPPPPRPPPSPPPPPPPPTCPPGRWGPSRRCFLRIVGKTTCPDYSRPHYRSWWPVLGGAAVTTPFACAQRRQVFQATLRRCGGWVAMNFCRPAQYAL